MPEIRQAAQCGRNRAAQLVVAEAQVREIRQAAQCGRNRAAQLVVAEDQVREIRQAVQLGRNRAAQLVPGEAQVREIRQAAQCGRNRAVQRVTAEVQTPEVLQRSQLGRDRAGQVVPGEVQALEFSQRSQLGRDRAVQLVATQRKVRYPAVRVGGHPVPLAHRRRRLPVTAVRPARAAGRIIEFLQRSAIRRDTPLRDHTGRGRRRKHNRQHGYGCRSRNPDDPRELHHLTWSRFWQLLEYCFSATSICPHHPPTGTIPGNSRQILPRIGEGHAFRSRCVRSRRPSPCPRSGRRALSSSATRAPRSAARAPAFARSTGTP